MPRARGGSNFGLNPGLGGSFDQGFSGVPGINIQIGQDDQNGNQSGKIYDDKGNVTGFYQNSHHSWSFPGGSGNNNGNGAESFNQGSQQNVFDAMNLMNRQMNQMMRQFNSPGMGFDEDFSINPESVNPLNVHPHMQISPNMPGLPNSAGARPKSGPSNNLPQPRKFTQPREDLPAYTDPNSI